MFSLSLSLSLFLFLSLSLSLSLSLFLSLSLSLSLPYLSIASTLRTCKSPGIKHPDASVTIHLAFAHVHTGPQAPVKAPPAPSAAS